MSLVHLCDLFRNCLRKLFVTMTLRLRLWVCCLAAIGAGLIGTARTSNEPGLECQRSLLECTHKAIAPYLMLNFDESLAAAKATSLTDHCRDWSEASACNRRTFSSSECTGQVSIRTQQYMAALNVLDFLANYSCEENFNKIERNFRCFLDRSTYQIMIQKCNEIPMNNTDACDVIPLVVECASQGITLQCGEEAGEIVREIGPWPWKELIQAALQKKCSPPKKRNLFATIFRRFFIP